MKFSLSRLLISITIICTILASTREYIPKMGILIYAIISNICIFSGRIVHIDKSASGWEAIGHVIAFFINCGILLTLMFFLIDPFFKNPTKKN